MKARYVCRLETRYFKQFEQGDTVAVSVNKTISYRKTTEEPIYLLFETRNLPSEVEVVFNKGFMYVCQDVTRLRKQIEQLTELAESLNNFTLWIAASVVIDDLIMFKVRKQLIKIPDIIKKYELFNKCRALAISTDKQGERNVAIRKAVQVGLRITT